MREQSACERGKATMAAVNLAAVALSAQGAPPEFREVHLGMEVRIAISATGHRRQHGAIVGRLAVSGTGTPVAFGNDRVVVRTTDNDGVVAMEVRRIIREAMLPDAWK